MGLPKDRCFLVHGGHVPNACKKCNHYYKSLILGSVWQTGVNLLKITRLSSVN